MDVAIFLALWLVMMAQVVIAGYRGVVSPRLALRRAVRQPITFLEDLGIHPADANMQFSLCAGLVSPGLAFSGPHVLVGCSPSMLLVRTDLARWRRPAPIVITREQVRDGHEQLPSLEPNGTIVWQSKVTRRRFKLTRCKQSLVQLLVACGWIEVERGSASPGM